MRPGAIRDRIYADFFMPSRLGEYEGLLRHAIEHGYSVHPLDSYWTRVVDGTLDREGRHLLLRHDVDTDPATAATMWRIDRQLGLNASFFYRLSTLDIGTMQAMASAGAHASYHYEELATVAKARRPRTAAEAKTLVPEARELFASNVEHLRGITGLPLTTVASHGDFLNRRLGIKNTTVLADAAFRAECGIVLETYDQAFLDTATSYHRDMLYPEAWMHGDPYAAIERGEQVVYLLIHPRPWRVDRVGNLRDDIARVREGLGYRLPRRQRRG